MTEPLDREELIGLLNRLGSEDDTEALEAARKAHARVAAAGASWDEVLAPEESDEPDEEDWADGEPGEEDAVESPGEAAEKNAESLALIGKLLARKDISEEMRTELKGYKDDIAENEFTEADRKYLRAVSQRLKK